MMCCHAVSDFAVSPAQLLVCLMLPVSIRVVGKERKTIHTSQTKRANKSRMQQYRTVVIEDKRDSLSPKGINIGPQRNTARAFKQLNLYLII